MMVVVVRRFVFLWLMLLLSLSSPGVTFGPFNLVVPIVGVMAMVVVGGG